ncbi:MAG: histidinol dehydrogenase [Spartobacteria bacterium]|nr:histidinol dehydrogenase [Spartobacteria bacterium]
MSLDKKGSIRIVEWSPGTRNVTVSAFLKRPAVEEQADHVAREVLADIRARGDAAVLEYAAKFDGGGLTARTMKVSQKEKLDARAMVDPDFKNAVREAHARIVRFAKAGLRKDWTISSPKGGILGERYLPFERVGAYIPGGAAPLASTALMTVTLAKVAGVLEIVACTPADDKGSINPYMLFALDIAGATEIYKIGGIQSIGAMAYGTKTIPKVQKIVGPGGPYVTAAKRAVYGDVALDMVAGPSEIAVLADDAASPVCVAADLLSQAEHGTGSEKSLLVTSSKKLAQAVREELLRQVETLSRREAIQTVFSKGLLLVVVEKLDDGIELCNQFAAEHLELLVREPRRWVDRVRAAGAIFIGNWTPESAGDFVAGPSHVLPTGGTASMFSGLTVEDFRRRSSVISFTRADLQDVLPVIEAFGRVEGLDAHARSARVRFEQSKS